MRLRDFVLGTGLIIIGATAAVGAVSVSQFPPRTVADLVAICAPGKDDPLMTASVNFCQGYAEGAVDVEEAHEEQRHSRKLFCLPTPRVPRGTELTDFIAWAKERPARLDMPAIDGLFVYLAEKYPCPTTGSAKRRSQ
jgi:Rap1a immunity proteins